MNDINKDELLDVKKWQRLFFMVIYAAAANFVIGIVLFLIFLQFIFYLFTSNINDQLKSANNWLKDFLIDSLNFLTFNTNDKPFPFKNKVEAEAGPEPEVEAEAEPELEVKAEAELEADEKVIDAEVEELDADEPSSKEPN
tara:strand:+ start:187 stop:609 length:423 start_codon:yes stop_codon:yes gene_type:complete